MAEGVPTNNQRRQRSGPCRLWGGLDKARNIVPTALLIRVQCFRKGSYKAVEGPSTRPIVLSVITGSYCHRRSPQRQPKKKIDIKPATFDGTNSWKDYKSHFDACAKINNWSIEEKGLFLAVSLRAQAQGVLGDLPEDTNRHYYVLVQALEERFAPPNQTEGAIARQASKGDRVITRVRANNSETCQPGISDSARWCPRDSRKRSVQRCSERPGNPYKNKAVENIKSQQCSAIGSGIGKLLPNWTANDGELWPI